MWKIIILLSCLTHCVLCQVITPITIPVTNSLVAPTWDDKTQSLYFTSLETSGQQSSIFRYSFIDGVFYSAYIEGVNSVSFILPAKKKCVKCKHLFVVGVGNQVLTIKWNGRSNRAVVMDNLFPMDANIPFSRTGRARLSPKGRFYGGTFFYPMFCNASAALSFYRFEKKKGLLRIFGNVVSTTGIAFYEDTNALYHLDTCQLLLTEFYHDSSSGQPEEICNGRVVFDFSAYGGLNSGNFPLGLESDRNGLLYVAQPQSIWVIDPRTSTLVRTIDFPSPVLNGMAFGGPNRDILYVIASQNYPNVFALNDIIAITNTTTSLYAVTGLGAIGFPSSDRLVIP